MFGAILFDMDGVLVQSNRLHWEAYRRTFAALEHDFSWEDYLRVGAGAAREVVITRVLGALDDAELRCRMDEKERHVLELLEERGLERVPGALEFVGAARDRGLRLAVATASRSPAPFLRAAGYDGLFEVVIGRLEVDKPKPAPDAYLEAARAVSTPPESCLVIEDSATGVEAARNAGMRVIALTTTEDAAGLTRADRVLAGFADLDIDALVDAARDEHRGR